MPSLTTSLSAALLVGLLQSQAPVPEPVEWTWVIGHYEDASLQARYAANVDDTFRYYQGAGDRLGRVVPESTLEAAPTEPVVFCGPLEAFSRRDWLAPFSTNDRMDRLELGGIALDDPTTGIYYRSRDGRRVFMTGLSFGGWMSIFSMPTGGEGEVLHDCTIVVDGTVAFEGDHGPDGGLVLRRTTFLPRLPALEELERLAPHASAIRTSGIYPEASAEEAPHALFSEAFSQHIGELIEGQRTLFVGEFHSNSGVNRVFRELLTELLGRTRVRAVFLENQFSFSAHFDHYAHIADDKAARDFRARELEDLIVHEDVLATLELLRVWNKMHPAATVSVACVDLEFQYRVSLDRVIDPYLRWYDPEYGKAGSPSASYAAALALLDRIETGEFERKHPFIEAEFIRHALQNLSDTLTREQDPRDRCRSNVRNITVYHAPLFDEGLIVFKMGGWHAMRHAPEVDGYWREAAYLDQVYPPTKGRVRTLELPALGYRFSAVRDFDVRPDPLWFDQSGLIRGFQRDLQRGAVRLDDCFLQQKYFPIHEQLVAREALRTGAEVLWLQAVDRERLAEVTPMAPCISPLDEFDSVLYVVGGQFEAPLPR